MPKQLGTSIVLLAIGLLAVGQAQMRVGPQVPVPASIQVPGDGITVPMQDMEGRPVIDVKINGKGPYRFVLDTGATTTVVSGELSRELSHDCRCNPTEWPFEG
jgi:predicted aspartyl protease